MRFRYQSKKVLLVVCCVWLTLPFNRVTGQPHDGTIEYGLAFASHEATKDQRTSLDLNPDASFEIRNDFKISFDLSYQRLTNAFGYILRLIANDSLNIDLVSSPEHSEFYDLNLIIGNAPVQIHYDFTEIQLRAAAWNRVIISVSPSRNEVSVSWNGHLKTAQATLNNLQDFRFLFGANDFGKFNTSDVPPIILRNVEISVKEQSWLKWELKKHNADVVYDATLEHRAISKNATWLIDQHATWVRRKEFNVGKFPSAAFDTEHGILFVTDATALTEFDLNTDELSKEQNLAGSIIHTDANQLLFIPERRSLQNYNVFTGGFTTYDFASKRWDNYDTAYSEPRQWHNNKFFNPIDSSLYSFGGYGFYLYSNAFDRYDFTTHKWEKVAVNGSIPPRYLGALGLNPSKSEAFIFGGYGSLNGKQELSPQAFYDLHKFDLRTHLLTKVWDLKSEESKPNTVFSNSLVVNEVDSCFYVLAYPKDKYRGYLQLESYALRNGERKLLGDSVLFLFHDVHSFCDLFYSRKTKELVAVSAHKEGDGYAFQVHSINYPPLSAADTRQEVPSKMTTNAKLTIAAAGVGILLLAVGAMFYRRRKSNTASAITGTRSAADAMQRAQINVLAGAQPDINAMAGAHPAPVAAVHARPMDHLHAETALSLETSEQKHSSIDLFGGFQVIDKSGNDITHKFTSTLRELFLFILLHSVRFDKGVSTAELHEAIWPDKDEVSARNNRNVNLKKLRALLQEIGDNVVENTNSYVRVILEQTTSCDYQVAYRILNSEQLDRRKAEILLKYVRKGSLLPNMQAAWMDSFKSDTSNRLIDVLLAYSEGLDMDRDDKILLDIADSIFNYDAINQEAMVLKCSVLNKKGKHSLAKNWYDHFAKEYHNLYGETYPRSFDEIVL